MSTPLTYIFFNFQLHTHRHSRWCRCSAISCELRSRDTADHSVHATAAWDITPGVWQMCLALRQRDLHALTLHLLHPVGLLTDLCPQPERAKKRRRKRTQRETWESDLWHYSRSLWSYILQRADVDFTWRMDQLTSSPTVSWRKENITFWKCIFTFSRRNNQLSCTLPQSLNHALFSSSTYSVYQINKLKATKGETTCCKGRVWLWINIALL